MKNSNNNLTTKFDEKAKNSYLKSVIYPSEEDIYNANFKEIDINPEDISKNKIPAKIEYSGTFNKKSFKEDVSGSDLDIPGSELDDEQENLGNEDEENNYYSLGSDDHNDLDEN